MSTQHIIIGDMSPRIQYVGNGSQTSFTYPFPIFKHEDLEVYVDDTLQVGGYTVSGVGVSNGGTVTFALAPATDKRVTLIRNLPIERVSDFQEAGHFRAKTINDELDYLTACLQQIETHISCTVHLSQTSMDGMDLILPKPKAGFALIWNQNETGLENTSIDVRGAVEAAAAAQSMYDQILALISHDPGLGYAGLVHNLLGILKCRYPENFDDWGCICDEATGWIDHGLITDPCTSAPNYGVLYPTCDC